MKIREWIAVYLKGLAMGSADAVPGVSGGTIALIVGIYERLVHSITSMNTKNILYLSNSIMQRDEREVRSYVQKMDLVFLSVLFTGIISAVVIVLRLMHYFLEYYTVQTFGFFLGLILMSVIVLFRDVALSTNVNKISAVSGFLIAFFVSGFVSTSVGHSTPVIFLSGMVAVSAMVLPGISGSLMLVILGQYEYVSRVLTSFTDGLIQLAREGSLESISSSLPPIIAFLLGAVIGLFSVSHLVRKALEKRKEATMAFLVSLVAGGLRAPLVEIEKALAESGKAWMGTVPELAFSAFFGALLIFLLDRKAGMI